MRSRRRIPTDEQILKTIYRAYYDEYVAFSDRRSDRSTKIYVPVDIERMARDLGVEGDILFGRLYYHLEHKYAYQQDDGAWVHFFALRINGDCHCVHFPFMASILADFQEQSRKYNRATWIAAAALLVSAISVIISIFAG
jgi:hypothetical protein